MIAMKNSEAAQEALGEQGSWEMQGIGRNACINKPGSTSLHPWAIKHVNATFWTSTSLCLQWK